MEIGGGVKLTWLGHSTFKLVTPKGKIMLLDPWVSGNPACPESEKQIDRCDIMLVTHGHFDHIGDAVAIALATNPQVVGIFEICNWMKTRGVQRTCDMNKGGTQVVDGIRVTMVHADHSCGIIENDQIIYAGEAVGYVIELENGLKIYYAGDTAVFGDMRIIGELYRPDVAMLPIGDHYTMSPREAAYAIRLIGAKKVVPMHFGTFPLLTGTPDRLAELTKDIAGLEIARLRPGQTLS